MQLSKNRRSYCLRPPLYWIIKTTFNETENGTDNTFDNLSNEAKKICFDTWERVKHSENPISILTRELDDSKEFRRAVGRLNRNKLPQETDAVVRYFKWIMENQ